MFAGKYGGGALPAVNENDDKGGQCSVHRDHMQSRWPEKKYDETSCLVQ